MKSSEKQNFEIKRSIETNIRTSPTFEERWRGQDQGMITAWEVGRKRAIENPELKNATLNNELPVLGYIGGYEKTLSIKFKYAPFHYLAEWQGLRGDDLDIDSIRDEGKVIVCSKTNMKTIFTLDSNKYSLK